MSKLVAFPRLRVPSKLRLTSLERGRVAGQSLPKSRNMQRNVDSNVTIHRSVHSNSNINTWSRLALNLGSVSRAVQVSSGS